MVSQSDKKQEFLLALRMLGKGLKEKGYDSRGKIIALCKSVRKEVF